VTLIWILHTPMETATERRVRARGLQARTTAPVGRVPSRGVRGGEGSVSEEDDLALSVFQQRRFGECLQVGDAPASREVQLRKTHPPRRWAASRRLAIWPAPSRVRAMPQLFLVRSSSVRPVSNCNR